MSEQPIADVIAAVRAARLTYCGSPKMENLALAAAQVLQDNVPGCFVEAGVALGGSAIVLGRIRPSSRALYLYDVFAMIPAPSSEDGEDAHRRYEQIASGRSPGLGGDVYYGYRENLVEVVMGNLRDFGLDPGRSNIHLRRGLFEEAFFPPAPVALAHIDCDWHRSVKTCIDRLLPVLSPGAIVVFDDYSSYSGCRDVVDALLSARNDFRVVFKERSIGLRKGPAG